MLHWPKRIGADATTIRVTGSGPSVAGGCGKTDGMLDHPCGSASETPAWPTRCSLPPSSISAARRASVFIALSTTAARVEVRAPPWGEREVPYGNDSQEFRTCLCRLCDKTVEPSVELCEQRLQVERRVEHRDAGAVFRARPFLAWPVAVELDPVPVRVAQIDRLADAVV